MLPLGTASEWPNCGCVSAIGVAGPDALPPLVVGRFSKWLCAECEMAERESRRLFMISGDVVCVRM
jgi:hypothetical protein